MCECLRVFICLLFWLRVSIVWWTLYFTEIINWCGLRCVYVIHTQSTGRKVAHMCMKPENLWNERWCETLFVLYNKHFFELINTLEIASSWHETRNYSLNISYCEFKSQWNFKHFQLYKNIYVRLCCVFHNLWGKKNILLKLNNLSHLMFPVA